MMHIPWFIFCLVVVGPPALVLLLGAIELFVLSIAAMLPPARRQRPGSARPIRLGIVVPAHNEELLISQTVESLLEAAKTSNTTRAHVVVVADNCTDRTGELARAAGAQVIVRTNAKLRGKGYALQMGFEYMKAAGVDAVVVVDADSVVSRNFLEEIAAKFASGAAAVQAAYLVRNADQSWRTSLGDLALVAFNMIRPRGRDRLGLSCGIYGNGFALSMQCLEAVPYDAFSIVEDLEYHLKLVSAGLRVEFAPNATIFGQYPAAKAAAATQRTRWEGGRLATARKWLPRLLTQVLAAKWRAIEPGLDLICLPLALYAALCFAIIAAGGAANFAGVDTPVVLAMAARIGVVSTLVLAFHVGVAAVAAPDPKRVVSGLLMTPAYVIWKFSILRKTINNASLDAEWVRTGRER